MRFCVLIITLVSLFACLETQNLQASEEPQLIKMVVLSRHGVRAPTQSETILSYWSQKPWPQWPVERGELTERGAGLVTEMWKNLRLRFAALGLLPENACPRKDLIYVRADVDERTKATAKAILDGLAANCDLGFAFLENARVDPLFHPVRAGLFRFNAVEAARDILEMADGNLGIIQDDLFNILSTIGSILGPPAAALCTRFTMVPDCDLGDLPNAISISPDGKEIRLMGSLDIASSVAEIFLLEFAQWPGEPAGWGLVSEKVLEQIMPVHTKVFNIVNRAPVIALVKGSPLLKEMADALTNSHYDPRCNDARLVIFVGHDTNIANIGSLLKIDWHPDGFPENGIPPAGALALELWKENGKFQIIARFYSQTPETLHLPLPDADKRINTADFKPAESSVTNPPAVGEMRYEPDEFMRFINKVTAGGVSIPRSNPPLYYGNVEPSK